LNKENASEVKREEKKTGEKNLSFIHLSFSFFSSILRLRQDQKASATSNDNSKLHAEIHLTIITDPSQVFIFLQYKHISICLSINFIF